ncbi:alpha-amylase family glycosyl hydrolase, partial [Stenotrophomonas sp. Betaine-02u-23]
MTTLRATVRLQLHAGFDFDAAAAQVDYFARLGISHLYLSPIASAVPGSTHGYDNVDPTRISPELGGEQGFRRLSDAARQHGMGILLDIVPNHMAVHPANAWWNDVLRNGRRSAHAGWFDIDWDAPECDGRLWLAVLDRPLAAALADGVLHLDIDGEGPCLRHHDLALPLSPLSYPAQADSWPGWIARCQRSPQRMQDVLQRQAYRLGWWRTGADHTNYRRFFDIDGLVALRMELPEVFDAVHALPLRLVAEGHVDGLRVDHVDGLADPQGYLGRLRSGLDQAAMASGRPAEAITLHVEKILADDEALPADWACDGTTGYDFMDQVGALLHDSEAGPALHALWHSASG